MKIKIDDLSGKEIAALLEEHLNDMRGASPPESKHALDLDGLRKPDITFWTVWDDQILAGCGAIKQLDHQHAELKSMRIARTYLRRGVGSLLLQHIIDEASKRGFRRLGLETGSMPFFEPARRFYAKFGFEYCAPFAGYREDPNSVFMMKVL